MLKMKDGRPLGLERSPTSGSGQPILFGSRLYQEEKISLNLVQRAI